jgi:site-specific recombinase XerD
MAENKQPALLPQDTPQFTATASLQAALGLFQQYLRHEGKSENTVKAFSSDIRLLGKFLGIGQPIGEIGLKDLNDFLDWLLNERGVPCSPKSYARRVTTLKVFFGWLHEKGVLGQDPAAGVIQKSATPRLPTVPTEEEIGRALSVTQAIRDGDRENRADARPHLLLELLLQTGMKKSEVMNLVPNHIDRYDEESPYVFVRYANPNYRYKERKLPISPDWLEVLDEYLEQYKVRDTLFDCTARNLEYILTDVGEEAGLDRGLLSFENLRWTAVLRDYRHKADSDDIRQKLGLSPVTWRETEKKLQKIAERQEEMTEEEAMAEQTA